MESVTRWSITLCLQEKVLELFAQSWISGIFPKAWKEAIITHVLKKEKDLNLKKGQLQTHQPAQLPQQDPSMHGQQELMWHNKTNDLITKEQTVFRKNRSTEDKLVYLALSMENAFQKKKKVVATFTDLFKAFDKLWKEGLLLKILTAMAAEWMFSWIKSFLCHTAIRVKPDNSLSHTI